MKEGSVFSLCKTIPSLGKFGSLHTVLFSESIVFVCSESVPPLQEEEFKRQEIRVMKRRKMERGEWKHEVEGERKGGKRRERHSYWSELGGCGSHWSLAEEPALSLKCRAQGICRACDLNHWVHPMLLSSWDWAWASPGKRLKSWKHFGVRNWCNQDKRMV